MNAKPILDRHGTWLWWVKRCPYCARPHWLSAGRGAAAAYAGLRAADCGEGVLRLVPLETT